MWSDCHVIPAGGGREGEWVELRMPRPLPDIMQEVCHQYWPGERPERYGEYTVENTGEETHDGYIKRNLMMADKVTLTVVWAPCIHLYNQLTKYCNDILIVIADMCVHVRKVHHSDSTASLTQRCAQ